MEPIQFLDAVSGYARLGDNGSSSQPIKLARIDPTYNPFDPLFYPDSVPPAKVTFEGESTLSGKLYPVAVGYIPKPDARVWMVPIGTTYMIAGGADTYTSQGFHAEADGSSFGVEFGGENYWDSDLGLNLDTDADIAGDLFVGGLITHSARGIRIPEFRFGRTTFTGPGTGVAISASATLTPNYPVGTTVSSMAVIEGAAGATAHMLSRSSATPSSISLTVLKSDIARADFTAASTGTFCWMTWAYPAS